MSIRIKRQISSKSVNTLVHSNTLTSLEELMLDLEEGVDDDDPQTNSGSNFGECFIEYQNVSRKLYFKDLFYSIIQFRFWILFVLIIFSILFFVFIFSLIYYAASPTCGLHLHENGYQADSFLYAILIQFRTVLEPHPEFNTPFWNGCSAGIAGLFFQLFGGNVLMSILTSSLIFSFQSISRRGKSGKFSLITLTQTATIRSSDSKDGSNYTSANSGAIQIPEHFFTFSAVDTNMSSNLKINNCVATVYLFDPHYMASSSSLMTCVATRVPIMISLPNAVEVEIPKKYLFRENHPGVIFEETRKCCQVCGKPIAKFNDYLKHLWASDDTEHDIEYENVRDQLDRDPKNDILPFRQIIKRELQFIVIVDGSDPITGDRVQVQKIYTPEMLREKQDDLVGISGDGKNEATIEYLKFL